MNILELIIKKRDGHEMSKQEIAEFVEHVCKGDIPDYQLGAWLMATYFRGMSDEETGELTLQMAKSGKMLDLSGINGVTVDKHSTGGVGDTTTLILAPLAAACGMKVAKLSGRGLGHGGGTVDKLESIPGFQVEIPFETFIKNTNDIGVCLAGQTQELATADKILYLMRDVTGTVESLPLIASSVMCKKIASGAQAIVLDVKCGRGAFMQTEEQALKLAKIMCDIGKHAGRTVSAIVTDMNRPLGTHIGNALEVKEAIDVLCGRTKGPLLEVSLLLGSYMAKMAGCVKTVEEGRALLQGALDKGYGAEKFKELIVRQGGDASVVDDTAKLPQAKKLIPVPALASGTVMEINALDIGWAAHGLGAGRVTKADVIDPAVGLVMHCTVGDKLAAGEPIATLYVNDESKAQKALEMVQGAVAIGEGTPSLRPLVLHEIEA